MGELDKMVRMISKDAFSWLGVPTFPWKARPGIFPGLGYLKETSND